METKDYVKKLLKPNKVFRFYFGKDHSENLTVVIVFSEKEYVGYKYYNKKHKFWTTEIKPITYFYSLMENYNLLYRV